MARKINQQHLTVAMLLPMVATCLVVNTAAYICGANIEKKVDEKYVLHIPEQKTFSLPEIEIPKSEPVEVKEPICLGTFRLTGYCPCEQCSEGYGGITATGVYAQSNHTIAVDPSVIPYGTHVMIRGQEYVAEDCGGLVKGNRIDIYVDTHEECFSEFCNGFAEVYLIEGV